MSEAEKSDDLRSLLAAAADESMASTALSSGTVEPAAKSGTDVADKNADDASSSDAVTGDRPRAADGKFQKKEAADDKADEKADDKKAAGKDAEAKGTDDKQAKATDDKGTDDKASPASGRDAPSNWNASDKAMFKLQSPEAQDFLLRRHKAMEADYTKKVELITDLRKEYEPVQQFFAPYLDVLKQKGLTPQTVIKRWADVESALASGKGVDIIDGIVKSYGIDKAQLGQRLGFTSSPQAQRGTDQQQAEGGQGASEAEQLLATLEARIAKAFEPKLAKIDRWETHQQTATLEAARNREAQVEAEIATFKGAANEKGDLLHPYFDEVEPAMIALASSYAASKQAIPPLAELYETAVWANPSTRAALQAAQRATDEAKRNEEARAKAASARKAASSVTGAPGSGQASRPIRSELSLREQLEEAAADLG